MDNSNVNLSLKGNKVILNPFDKKYFDIVYNWNQDCDTKYLSSTEARIVTKNEFNDMLKCEDYHIYLLIVSTTNNVPIGYIYSNKYNKIDEYINVSIFLEDVPNREESFIETINMFYNYLFTCFPIRKIYNEMFEYNVVDLKILRKIGCKIEAKMKDDKFFDRKYHNKYILAMYNYDFLSGG